MPVPVTNMTPSANSPRLATKHSRVELAYDPLGRLVREATTSAAGTQTLTHEYDAFGNRLSTTLPNGKTLNGLYYGSGHLHQINLDGEVISDYERDALHREISRTQGQLHSSTHYDPLGRILQQQTRDQTAHDDDAQASPLNPQPRSFSPDNRVHDPISHQAATQLPL